MSIVYFTKAFQPVPALFQLYRELGGDFVTTRHSTSRAIRQSYPGTRTSLMRGLLPHRSTGGKLLENAKLIVTGSPYKGILEKYSAPKYNVFHGTYTYLGPRDLASMKHFDCLCAIGPRMREMMELSAMGLRYTMSGYLPFMDYPVQTDDLRRDILKPLGLDPALPTVLYVPTGRPLGSWDWLSRRLIEEVSPNFNLILRPHPSQSISARIHDLFQFTRLKSLARKRGAAVIDLAGCKLSNLYAVADLVVSDGTSTAEESLYYDTPQVFVESPTFSRKHVATRMQEQGAPQPYLERLLTLYDCGKILTPENTGLTGLLESAITDEVRYAESRAAHFQWVFGERDLTVQTQFIASLRHSG